jgi:phosphate:Na+ symporter
MSSGSFADGILGGLGLFLLGAWLALEGLAATGVPWLRAKLAGRPDARWRGWAAGAGLALGAPLSESSSRSLGGLANTGLVSLRTTLWVAAGHALGLAGAAWLFVLLARNAAGDALALALVAGGVAARWSGPERRRGAIGRALAGWGLLLFGLGLLADGFEHARGILRLDSFGGGTALRVVALGIVGLSFAAFLRSGAAAVALAIAAASAGALETTSALAVGLGALLGSSWGAGLALESGTGAARRAALGAVGVHLFAALGGAVLLACSLPLLADPPGALADPAVATALLLTLAPLVPVLALVAFDGTIAHALERLFQRQDRLADAPHHVDTNLDALPELGLDALVAEAGRMQAVSRRLASRVLTREPVSDRRRETDRETLRALAGAVEQGVAALARRPLSERAAQALPALTRAAQAIWETGEQGAWLHDAGLGSEGGLGAALEARVLRLQLDLARLLDEADALDSAFAPDALEGGLAPLERRIEEIRGAALQRCSQGEVAPAELERACERLTTLRRLGQLAVDSACDLYRARGEHPAPAPAPEPEPESEPDASEVPAAA